MFFTPLIDLISRHWRILSLLQLAFVTLACLTPAPELPDVPGTDKLHHVVAFFCVALPLGCGRPKNWLFFAALLIAWSGAIELIQPYVNRVADWVDLGADTLGVVLGVITGQMLSWLRTEESAL